MLDTKREFEKLEGRQCYHIIQSFKPGEVTPELALEIAKEFAAEYLADYEVVIGTHVDKNHIHSHLVFNSVNAQTGQKYHVSTQEYYRQIRTISDRLCREHGLSVIMEGQPTQAVSYIECLRQSKGQPTFRSMLEADLRSAIEDANDLGHFFMLMEHRGYEIYLAYNNICAGQGNMTAGVDGQTIDGMSDERIQKIIASLKDHSYQPNPARREYIAKKNSEKMRPLGIPSAEDKLVQEVVRMILESIYEPSFSPDSHGFRPKRSCHTALKHIDINFKGAVWFVEGDIKACFDSFDHHIMVDILRARISDEYFLVLIWKFLRAGYMEQWQYHKTYSGTPQGSGVSPILANIYLDRLDCFMHRYKRSFDVGISKNRKVDSDYLRARDKYHKLEKSFEGQWDTTDPGRKVEMDRELRRARNEMFVHPSRSVWWSRVYWPGARRAAWSWTRSPGAGPLEWLPNVCGGISWAWRSTRTIGKWQRTGLPPRR